MSEVEGKKEAAEEPMEVKEEEEETAGDEETEQTEAKEEAEVHYLLFTFA